MIRLKNIWISSGFESGMEEIEQMICMGPILFIDFPCPMLGWEALLYIGINDDDHGQVLGWNLDLDLSSIQPQLGQNIKILT